MKDISEAFTEPIEFGINMTPRDAETGEATGPVESVQFVATGHLTRGSLLMALQQVYQSQVLPMAMANLVAESEEEFYSLLEEDGVPVDGAFTQQALDDPEFQAAVARELTKGWDVDRPEAD